jgi:hypothetical protein
MIIYLTESKSLALITAGAPSGRGLGGHENEILFLLALLLLFVGGDCPDLAMCDLHLNGFIMSI